MDQDLTERFPCVKKPGHDLPKPRFAVSLLEDDFRCYTVLESCPDIRNKMITSFSDETFFDQIVEFLDWNDQAIHL
jgi:hypothetical protein